MYSGIWEFQTGKIGLSRRPIMAIEESRKINALKKDSFYTFMRRESPRDFYARCSRWWLITTERECPQALLPLEIEDHVNFRWLIASFMWHVWRHTREFIVLRRETIYQNTCSTFRKSKYNWHSSWVLALATQIYFTFYRKIVYCHSLGDVFFT